MNEKRIGILFILLLIIGLVLAMTGTALAAGGPRAISVDARNPIGFIRSLQGMHWDPGPKGEALSENYRLIGIDTIRTHDAGGIEDATTPSAGVGDIDGIGPVAIFPDFNADPLDPENYNFDATDQLIRNIRDTGAEVFFRVGRSNIGGLANNYVPSDIA